MNFLSAFLVLFAFLLPFASSLRPPPLSYAASVHEKIRLKSSPSSSCKSVVSSPYAWSECWWELPVDNFDFENQRTWQMRYLINDTYWAKPKFPSDPAAGPVFFYTGNEGSIDLFATNTGLMWDLAPKFNALIVFAEHRYYGDSLPLGSQSYTNGSSFRFLTAEQALADYANFLPALMKTLNGQQAGIIAFGGSYGGMMSAYLRLKYPWVVDGAIAASAPVRMFTGEVDPGAYSKICSDDFFEANEDCGNGIAKSWEIMTNLASTPAGLSQLNEIFLPCSPLTSVSDVENLLFSYIANVYANMPMGGN